MHEKKVEDAWRIELNKYRQTYVKKKKKKQQPSHEITVSWQEDLRVQSLRPHLPSSGKPQRPGLPLPALRWGLREGGQPCTNHLRPALETGIHHTHTQAYLHTHAYLHTQTCTHTHTHTHTPRAPCAHTRTHAPGPALTEAVRRASWLTALPCSNLSKRFPGPLSALGRCRPSRGARSTAPPLPTLRARQRGGWCIRRIWVKQGFKSAWEVPGHNLEPLLSETEQNQNRTSLETWTRPSSQTSRRWAHK